MIVGNPIFPLPTSYSGINKLNQQFDLLQEQLASGDKAQTLGQLGSTRYTDLTVRARLGRMTGYDTNISTVNLRLDMMNSMLTSLSKINANTRDDSVPSDYGTNYINFATAPTSAMTQLTQVLTSLDTDLNGHYLFGGATVDTPPVATPDAIINGSDGKDGFKTVAAQRLEADQGVGGMGRLTVGGTNAPGFTTVAPDPTVPSPGGVTLADGATPAQLLTGATATGSGNVAATYTAGTIAPPTPGSVAVTFNYDSSATPPVAPQDGDQVTINMTQPDGTALPPVTLTAVAKVPAGDVQPPLQPGQFLIGADSTETSANFQAAFNSVRPASTTVNDDVSPFGMKIIGVTHDVSPTADPPGDDGTISTSFTTADATAGTPAQAGITFNAVPKAGDTVSIQVQLPDGTKDRITLTATDSATPGPGEFSIAPTDPTTTPPTLATPADINGRFQSALTASIKNESQTTLAVASNFEASNEFFYSAGGAPQRIDGGSPANYATATGFLSPQDALSETVQWYTGDNQSQTNARATVTTKVDDSTSVNYGVQADEFGFTSLIKSLAVQSIQSYSANDTDQPSTGTSALDQSKTRFDAVAARVNTNLSTNQDGQQGSLAAIGVDLGLTQTTLKDLSDRHTAYGAQLKGVLSDAESADPNEVVSALLELQTRLSASYSAVSMLSQLQLANYLN